MAGGGGVALNVTRKLKDMGSWVWQLQRTDVRRCGGSGEGRPARVRQRESRQRARLQTLQLAWDAPALQRGEQPRGGLGQPPACLPRGRPPAPP